MLPLMLNCEHILFKLYAGTPLHLNPFLSHWVEVVQIYDGRVDIPTKTAQGEEESRLVHACRGWRRRFGARVELVKRILLAREGEV